MDERESNEAAGRLIEAIRFSGKEKAKRDRRNKLRRDRDQAMRDLGLTKVRGGYGGTYWE